MTNKIFSLALMFGLVLGTAFMVAPNSASAQVASFPAGCNSTMGYSIATGLPCNATNTASTSFMAGCTSIIGYSTTNGMACNGGVTATTTFLPGCSSVLGTSTLNGAVCSGGLTPLPFLAGCSSIYGYSTVNGQACNGTATVSFAPGVVVPGLPTTGAAGGALGSLMLLMGSGIAATVGFTRLSRRNDSI